MSSIINKRQLSLTLVVLALTTVMIAGTIFSSTSDDHAVFAKKHKQKQNIGQSNEQNQKAICLTSGKNSAVENHAIM